jgi:hypothetical protein
MLTIFSSGIKMLTPGRVSFVSKFVIFPLSEVFPILGLFAMTEIGINKAPIIIIILKIIFISLKLNLLINQYNLKFIISPKGFYFSFLRYMLF